MYSDMQSSKDFVITNSNIDEKKYNSIMSSLEKGKDKETVSFSDFAKFVDVPKTIISELYHLQEIPLLYKWELPLIIQRKVKKLNIFETTTIKELTEKVFNNKNIVSEYSNTLSDEEKNNFIIYTLLQIPGFKKIKSKDSIIPKILLNDKYNALWKDNYNEYIRRINEIKSLEDALSKVKPMIKDRTATLENVTMHLGPTNSGKTYHAIQAIIETFEKYPDAKIAYGGPLRMLAIEVYQKLSNIFGKEEVGMITGDTEINPEARLVACTVECVPDEGKLLVIDECHWSMDDDRGKSWTNLFTGANYENIILLGPKECESHFKFMLSDAKKISVHYHDRITKLKIEKNKKNKVKKYSINEIPKGTAIVTFSKKGALMLAGQIRKNTKLKVEALYGRMPMTSREEVVNRFNNGEIDIVVTTDVIGHGINLPINRLLFAETNKFDGKFVRNLKLWESAQIAGRAGRYGKSDNGSVAALKTSWGAIDSNIIKNAVKAANGDIPTELSTMKCRVSPTLKQLGIDNNSILFFPDTLQEWKEQMNKYLDKDSEMRKNIEVASLETLSNHLYLILANIPLDGSIEAELVWQLASGPFDDNSEVLIAAIPMLIDMKNTDEINNVWEYVQTLSHTIDDAENKYRTLIELKTLSMMWSEKGDLFDVAYAEELDYAEKKIIEDYNRLKGSEEVGICEDCGESTSTPWFKKCNDCYEDNRIYEYTFFF